MTKAQLRKELKLNIRTGLTIMQSANALINEFGMYAKEIREIELDLLTKEMLKGVTKEMLAAVKV